jgi:hypothetical protein
MVAEHSEDGCDTDATSNKRVGRMGRFAESAFDDSNCLVFRGFDESFVQPAKISLVLGVSPATLDARRLAQWPNADPGG